MNFKFTRNEFKDLVIIEPRLFKDERGFFYETYKFSDFKSAGINDNFQQDNQSFSKKGVVRGLHFQTSPHQQAKLVRCLQGEIYDVAVDLRKSSPTFGKYFGIKLSAENKLMFYIPAGFAHGFSVLSDIAELSYKVSAEYDKNFEKGIRWDDPKLAINWMVDSPIISEKDQELPLFDDAEFFE